MVFTYEKNDYKQVMIRDLEPGDVFSRYLYTGGDTPPKIYILTGSHSDDEKVSRFAVNLRTGEIRYIEEYEKVYKLNVKSTVSYI